MHLSILGHGLLDVVKSVYCPDRSLNLNWASGLALYPPSLMANKSRLDVVTRYCPLRLPMRATDEFLRT